MELTTIRVALSSGKVITWEGVLPQEMPGIVELLHSEKDWVSLKSATSGRELWIRSITVEAFWNEP